jgi:hypothetical protein
LNDTLNSDGVEPVIGGAAPAGAVISADPDEHARRLEQVLAISDAMSEAKGLG